MNQDFTGSKLLFLNIVKNSITLALDLAELDKKYRLFIMSSIDLNVKSKNFYPAAIKNANEIERLLNTLGLESDKKAVIKRKIFDILSFLGQLEYYKRLDPTLWKLAKRAILHTLINPAWFSKKCPSVNNPEAVVDFLKSNKPDV